MRRRKHPARRRRTWGWRLGAALFAWALAGTVGHLALVRHEICEAHGALVERWGHAPRASRGAAPRAHADAQAHRAHDAHDAQDAPGHDAHEPQKHCSLLVCASCLPVAPLVLPPLLFVRALVDVPGARPQERRSRSPLAVAPKTSPPRA